MSINQIAVLIPAVAVACRAREFNKPNSAFDESPGEQTFFGKGASIGELVGYAVEFLSFLVSSLRSIRSGTASCIRAASS